MKKIKMALTLVLAAGMAFVTVNSFARGWNSDPVDDPAFAKFLEQTVDIRKAIAIDRAELNALMAGENPDPQRVRDLTATIADNQEKLSEIARASDLGVPAPGKYGGCGGPRSGRGGCGSCGSAPNAFGGQGPGGGYGSCGTPGCPGASTGQQ